MRTNVSRSPGALLVLLVTLAAATSLGCGGGFHTAPEPDDAGDENPLISPPTPDGSADATGDATTDATAPAKDGGHEAATDDAPTTPDAEAGAADASDGATEAGATCAPPNLQCDAGCVPNDTHNCGSCGTVCPSTDPVCASSGSSYACGTGCSPPASTLCDGTCVDTTSNASNCGGCGAQYACTGGEQCVSGVCQCVGGQHLCGSTCVNNDANACGPSCTVCASPTNGTVACNGTSCVDSCTTAPYTTYCSGSNTCVDTATDSNNCGGCGAAYACSGGEQCVTSVCQCVGGQHLCGSTCVNNDGNACGPSCTVCSSPTNGTVACNGTSCVDSCTTSPYLTYCSASNACVDTANDVNNCGGCGITCLGGTCTSGTCSITFGYTGDEQTLVVSPGVSEVTITVAGAAGGNFYEQTKLLAAEGGLGGSVTATIAVASGETLAIYVGGDTFNGGGLGGSAYTSGAPGGGASDIRQGGNGLGNRVVVAGGGGGAGVSAPNDPGYGGAGGDTTGASGGNGGDTTPISGTGGGGGTSASPGSGGTGLGGCGAGGSGVTATGGNGGGCAGSGVMKTGGGGGGGGGYFGGGGGGGAAAGAYYAGGGGGGSSYAIPTATGVTMQQGVQSGNGQVVITY